VESGRRERKPAVKEETKGEKHPTGSSDCEGKSHLRGKGEKRKIQPGKERRGCVKRRCKGAKEGALRHWRLAN